MTQNNLGVFYLSMIWVKTSPSHIGKYSDYFFTPSLICSHLETSIFLVLPCTNPVLQNGRDRILKLEKKCCIDNSAVLALHLWYCMPKKFWSNLWSNLINEKSNLWTYSFSTFLPNISLTWFYIRKKHILDKWFIFLMENTIDVTIITFINYYVNLIQ